MLVMGAFVARDLTIMTSASAAVAGLDSTGLRTDPDFQAAVQWIAERCRVRPVNDEQLGFFC
jgi:hypothetical protein